MARGLELIDANDAAAERIWRELEQQAKPGYLLTWGWIASWLTSLPRGHATQLAVVHDDGAPRVAAFVAHHKVRRNLILQRSVLDFNAAGLLAAPGASRSLEALLALLPQDWDELHLPAVDPALVPDLAALSAHYRVRIDREETATQFDLTHVVAELPRDLEVVVDLATALELAGGDAPLRDVIAARFGHGEVQVLRSCAGVAVNLVAHGRALGYRVSSDAVIAGAVAYNAAVGNTSYELVGAGRGSGRRMWLRIERPLLRFALTRDDRPWYAALLATT
jgi:hypothetical protein